MSLRIFRIAALALIGVLAGPSQVQAATVKQTVNLGHIATLANSAFTFDAFDPSLGRLNAVTATFNGEFNNRLAFMNLGSAANFAIRFTQAATISGPDSSVFFHSGTVENSFSRTMDVNETFSADFNLAGGLNNLYSLPLQSYGGTKTWSRGSELALFSGVTKVSLPFIASATYISQIDNGFGLVLGHTYTRATMDLAYDYAAAVPEAETYLMLLVGLGALGLRFRRNSVGT